jgi:TRAP-type C4-dicarboxylate transport system permease small subunit
MTAKQRYRDAMEWLYVACIGIAGVGLVVITLMIPIGVFMRYVMHNPQSWPEPASVVLMVMLSFLGGAAVYRANVHVAVEALLNAVSPAKRRVMVSAVDACVGATALFMIVYGIQLCITTRFSTMAEFPWLSVAFVYAPIPLSGLVTLLFLIERVWLGTAPKTSVMYRDGAAELE